MNITRKAALISFGRALLDAGKRFDRKGGWVMSSHIAMSMMLALFPFILFIVALAGFLSQDVDTDNLIELVLGAWPEEVATPIINEIQTVVALSSSRLMTLGGVIAIYFASNGVDAVGLAMTQAYREQDPRPFWRRRLLALGFVLAGGAALLVVALIEVALPLYFRFLSEAAPQGWDRWITGERLRFWLTLAVPVLGVTACHLWLPGKRHRLRDIWPGVALTLVLWGAGVQLFTIYIVRFSTYGATYAGLAGAMAALIFMYLMAAILIFGAQFNGALMARKSRPAQ